MIAGIILAAGASSRMGRTKALLPLAGGRSFLAALAGALAVEAERTVAVIAHDAEAIRGAVERDALPLDLVLNPDPNRGQLSSLWLGLEAVKGFAPEAVLVAPVDQPLVTGEIVKAVVSAWRASGAPIVRPERDGRHGHPVLLAARLFDELRAASLAVGAREVLRRHHAEIVDVPVEDAGAFEDIDTPEDYERLIGPLR